MQQNNALYETFYDCMNDLRNILGVNSLKDMEIAIKFAEQSGFPRVAEYLIYKKIKFEYYIRREFEE